MSWNHRKIFMINKLYWQPEKKTKSKSKERKTKSKDKTKHKEIKSKEIITTKWKKN